MGTQESDTTEHSIVYMYIYTLSILYVCVYIYTLYIYVCVYTIYTLYICMYTASSFHRQLGLHILAVKNTAALNI